VRTGKGVGVRREGALRGVEGAGGIPQAGLGPGAGRPQLGALSPGELQGARPAAPHGAPLAHELEGSGQQPGSWVEARSPGAAREGPGWRTGGRPRRRPGGPAVFPGCSRKLGAKDDAALGLGREREAGRQQPKRYSTDWLSAQEYYDRDYYNRRRQNSTQGEDGGEAMVPWGCTGTGA